MADIQAILDEIQTDTVEHYGVLGMKWGVRKDRRTGKKVGTPTAGVTELSRRNTGTHVLTPPQGGDASRAERKRIVKDMDKARRHIYKNLGSDLKVLNSKYSEPSESYWDEATAVIQKRLDALVGPDVKAGIFNQGGRVYLAIGDEQLLKQVLPDRDKIKHEDKESSGYRFELDLDDDGLIIGVKSDEVLHEEDLRHILEHYGVLGMKWGVRKDRRTGNRVGKPVAGTNAASRDTPSVSRSRRSRGPDPNLKDLSNEHLRLVNERMRLEQEYKRLTAMPPTKMQKALKKSGKILGDIATSSVKRSLAREMGPGIDDLIKVLLKKKK